MTDRQPKRRPGWETVVCVAGGPSLAEWQCDALKTPKAMGWVKVIGVNNAYQYGNLWLDALLAVDLQWWKKHHADVKKRRPGLELVTQCASSHKQFALTTRIRGSARDGLGTHEIHTGGNGGHAAVNLAYLWGAKRIILLGYDMKLGPRGEKHWHPDHPAPCIQTQLFDHWIKRFESTAKDLERLGVQVWNATPDSALPWFDRCDIEQAMEMARLAAELRETEERSKCAAPSSP